MITEKIPGETLMETKALLLLMINEYQEMFQEIGISDGLKRRLIKIETDKWMRRIRLLQCAIACVDKQIEERPIGCITTDSSRPDIICLGVLVCPTCGFELKEGEQYCECCGKSLRWTPRGGIFNGS